jgi:hypothetical protein
MGEMNMKATQCTMEVARGAQIRIAALLMIIS